jgi:hypothetical protein
MDLEQYGHECPGCVGTPRTAHTSPVGADDPDGDGLRQPEAAFGHRVIEVLAEDGEHPVEGESLPKLDSEKVDQADRMAKEGAFGGLTLSLSYRCHGGHPSTPPVGLWPIAPTRHSAKTAERCLQEFHAAQHISLRGPSRGGRCPVSSNRDEQVGSRG